MAQFAFRAFLFMLLGGEFVIGTCTDGTCKDDIDMVQIQVASDHDVEKPTAHKTAHTPHSSHKHAHKKPRHAHTSSRGPHKSNHTVPSLRRKNLLTHTKSGKVRLASGVKGVTCQYIPCEYKGDCKSKPCCQDSLFKLLTNTADTLEAMHLPYFLMAGTLLGAIREKDIIPYTADVDIMMHSNDVAQLMSSSGEVAAGPDDWEGDKIFRACEKKVGGVAKAFTHGDRSLAYMDIYLIERWPDFLKFSSQMAGDTKAEIRGRQFPVPTDPESILTSMYGDWHEKVESAHG